MKEVLVQKNLETQMKEFIQAVLIATSLPYQNCQDKCQK